MKIVDYSKCHCGAVTLYFDNNQNNSIAEENLKKYGIEIPKDAFRLNDTYNCNHCVNHYGLDLCACGSGESPEKCAAVHREMYPMQIHYRGKKDEQNLKIVNG